jgi:NADPH:quinone reductase-like Zn-dependent oxidoreductase
MESVVALVHRGEIDVTISAVYPLEDGRAAYESGQDPHRLPGKTILAVDASQVSVTVH